MSKIFQSAFGPHRRQWLLDLARQWPWIYPRGVVHDARAWVRRAQQSAGWYAGLRTNWSEELHPDGLAIHSLPPDLPAGARAPFDDVASRRYPAAATFHFTGASLVGDAGLVATPDNRMLAEIFHHFGTQPARVSARGRAFQHTTTDTQRVGEAVGLLAAPEGWNYYHWLFDVLPRVHLLERWKHTIARYAVSARIGAVQLESLRLLGIGETQLLRLAPHRRIRCQHLYVPSLPGSEGCYPPWSLEFLRQAFLPPTASTPGQGARIYIQRGPAAQRPVVNEAELVAALARRGFQAVALETLGFAQQVAAFRDARVIVAAHGAGLANLAFATPGAALLELFTPDYLRPDCYFTLARRGGLKYDFWIDEAPKPAGAPWGATRADLAAINRKIDLLDVPR